MTEQSDAFIQNRNIGTVGNDSVSKISVPPLKGMNDFKLLSKRKKILIGVGSIVIIFIITIIITSIVVTIAAGQHSKPGKFDIRKNSNEYSSITIISVFSSVCFKS